MMKNVCKWLAMLALLSMMSACELDTLPAPQGRDGDKLTFSGRTWTVKGGEQLFGPGPNYFSKDLYAAYTDSNGYLHLNIRKLDDGNPLRGAVQVISGEEELCTINASQWDEAQGADCGALYIIR